VARLVPIERKGLIIGARNCYGCDILSGKGDKLVKVGQVTVGSGKIICNTGFIYFMEERDSPDREIIAGVSQEKFPLKLIKQI